MPDGVEDQDRSELNPLPGGRDILVTWSHPVIHVDCAGSHRLDRIAGSKSNNSSKYHIVFPRGRGGRYRRAELTGVAPPSKRRAWGYSSLPAGRSFSIENQERVGAEHVPERAEGNNHPGRSQPRRTGSKRPRAQPTIRTIPGGFSRNGLLLTLLPRYPGPKVASDEISWLRRVADSARETAEERKMMAGNRNFLLRSAYPIGTL